MFIGVMYLKKLTAYNKRKGQWSALGRCDAVTLACFVPNHHSALPEYSSDLFILPYEVDGLSQLYYSL